MDLTMILAYIGAFTISYLFVEYIDRFNRYLKVGVYSSTLTFVSRSKLGL